MSASDPSSQYASLEKRKAAQTVRAAARRIRAAFEENREAILGTLVIISIFLGIFIGLGFLRVYDLGFVISFLGTGLVPIEVALILTLASFFIGFTAAIPLGLVRAYAPGILRRQRGQLTDTLTYARAKELYGTGKAVRVVAGAKLRKVLLAPAYGFATGYMEGIRGTPFFVQMWIVFYAVSNVAPRLNFLGEDVFFWIALLALTLNTTGYQSEVMRAGFQSVGQGQIEAAKAIGMRGRQVFAHITFPQGLRLVILPLTNEWISLFKASSIVSYISVYELFLWSSSFIAYGQGKPLEAFVMVAIFYLFVNVPLSRAITYIEHKNRIPGLGTPMREARKRRLTGASRSLI